MMSQNMKFDFGGFDLEPNVWVSEMKKKWGSEDMIKDLSLYTIPMKVVGVGYRVRKEVVRSTELDGKSRVEVRNGSDVTVLVFDVGMSHSVRFPRPSYVDVTIDQSSTGFVLRGKSGSSVWRVKKVKVVLGDLAAAICKLRVRSSFTGNGIVWVDKVYPPLKSTKVAKK